jgi:hypothetical protein
MLSILLQYLRCLQSARGIFRSAKKLITPERNRLAKDIIEASERSKNWWSRGMIQQLRLTKGLGSLVK